MSHFRDEWPSSANGGVYDGNNLLELVRQGNNPFAGRWDPRQLIEEVEQKLGVQVVDIGTIAKGSNNYGIPLKTSEGRQLLARLARGDVNMPNFDGFPTASQVSEVKFEAATYDLLQNEPTLRASRLLYHRIPIERPGEHVEVPKDILGRRLLVFESSEGDKNVWGELDPKGKLALLDDLAALRTSLFHYRVPDNFAALFLRERLFDFKPDIFCIPVAPTRDFWEYVPRSKIEATIKELGDMIGWESDEERVGRIALAAKHSIIRAIPLILPQDIVGLHLYRFVLDHGDYGIHNTTIKTDSTGRRRVTSLFDWEAGTIVPAILSDSLVASGPVDLVTDSSGRPSVTRIPESSSELDLQKYELWAHHYIEALYKQAPDYEVAIKAGKHVRYLWFTLRDWRGGDSEMFFGDLGAWAEERIKELDPKG